MDAQLSGTRILLVDDHALFREGAARMLDAERDLKVVGRCGSVDEALEILGSTEVDLVLLDVDLGASSSSVSEGLWRALNRCGWKFWKSTLMLFTFLFR